MAGRGQPPGGCRGRSRGRPRSRPARRRPRSCPRQEPIRTTATPTPARPPASARDRSSGPRHEREPGQPTTRPRTRSRAAQSGAEARLARADRRDVADAVLGPDAGRACRGHGFPAHLVVGTVAHDDLPMIAVRRPHHDVGATPRKSLEQAWRSVQSCRTVRHEARQGPSGPPSTPLDLDDPAGDRRDLDSDSSSRGPMPLSLRSSSSTAPPRPDRPASWCRQASCPRRCRAADAA